MIARRNCRLAAPFSSPMRVLVMTLACLPLLTGAAQGATLRYHEDRGCHTNCFSFLELVDAAGEANVVSTRVVENIDTLRFRLRDDGAPLALDTAICKRVDDHEVECHAYWRLRVDLGDGDDVLRAPAHGTLGPGDDEATAGSIDGVLGGGPGSDVMRAGDAGADLHGDSGDDHLLGARANDTLDGGDGSDTIEGGDGDDRLIGSDGVDVLDGGSGRDEVSFLERTTGVVVDLMAGTAAEDRVTRVEAVYGTPQDDRLVGSDQDDTINGAGGRDVIVGGAGNDHLAAVGELYRLPHVIPPGGDAIDGGAGDDHIEAGAESRVDAGDGDDWVLSPGPAVTCGAGADRLPVHRQLMFRPAPPDCERIEFEFGDRLATISAHPTLRGGALRVGIPCPDAEVGIGQEPPLIMDRAQERAWLRLGFLRYGCRTTVRVAGTRARRAAVVPRHRRRWFALKVRRRARPYRVDVRMVDDVARRYRSWETEFSYFVQP